MNDYKEINFSKDFLTKPELDISGDLDCGILNRNLGYTLIQFNHCEEMLLRLLESLIDTGKNNLIFFRAVGSISDSHAKLEMFKRGSEALYTINKHRLNKNSANSLSNINERLFKDSLEIRKYYNKAQEFRNNLAHGYVYGVSKDIDNPEIEYFLVPQSFATKKRPSIFSNTLGKFDNALSSENKALMIGFRYNSTTICKFSDDFDVLYGQMLFLLQNIRNFQQLVKQQES